MIEPVNKNPKDSRRYFRKLHLLCLPFKESTIESLVKEGRVEADEVFVDNVLVFRNDDSNDRLRFAKYVLEEYSVVEC